MSPRTGAAWPSSPRKVPSFPTSPWRATSATGSTGRHEGAAGPTRCSPWWGSKATTTGCRTSSPAGSSNGWRWRGRSTPAGLVLLDEPFSSLDAGLRGVLRNDVRAALRADKATAVLVTHDQGEALSMADRVAVMRRGRILQSGTPAEIYQQPADSWLASFIGEANFLPGSLEGRMAVTSLGPLVLDDPVAVKGARSLLVLIRPEQLAVTPALAPDASGAATAGTVGSWRFWA
jgi:hypothetical protein